MPITRGGVVVENNSLGYQFAQLSMELERCKDDSCRQKVKQKQEELYQSSKENGKVIASVGVDLTPVAGDFKSFAEAEDWIDYTLAAAGMLPGAKFITKPLKEAKLLLKAGDLNGANKLIKEASDGISARTPTGSKGNPLNIIDGSNKPTIINNRNYSSHSLDRMQRQGITPTAVENTIRPENAVVGKRPGTTAYYDKDNHITVITDTKTDTVITVDYGKIKQ